MSNLNPYEYQHNSVASADVDERVDFIRKTYAHLAGAVMLFIVIECMAFMFTTVEQRMQVVKTMMGSRWGWLLVLGVFMGVSYIAERWAQSATSLSTQYLGLITYVVGEAVIFMPLLFIADTFSEGAIGTAAMITAVVFGGLTIFIFTTRTDLSGWGKYLSLLGFGAMGYILLGIFMPGMFGFGAIFSGLMVLLAAGYILYHTSNVLHHYQTTQYVAAALALFASVAILFWYVLQLVMSSDD